MPLLPALGLATSGISSLFKLGTGIAQLIKGGRMKPQRPTYEVNRYIKENQAMAQENLRGRSAGATRAEQNIFSNQAASLGRARKGATSSSQLLALGAYGSAQTGQQLLGLQAQEEQDRQRRLSNLQQQNVNLAQEETKAFEYNEAQKFREESAARSALLQGGIQNIAGGLGSAGRQVGQMMALEAMSPGLFGNMFKPKATAQDAITGTFDQSAMSLGQGAAGGANIAAGLGSSAFSAIGGVSATGGGLLQGGVPQGIPGIFNQGGLLYGMTPTPGLDMGAFNFLNQ